MVWEEQQLKKDKKMKKETAEQVEMPEEAGTREAQAEAEDPGEDKKPEKETEASEEALDREADEAGEKEGSEKPEEKEGAKKDPRDAKIEELNDKVMRQMAEFDNFRKRTEKEKEQMFEVGARSVIEKILPVVDNFERGLESAADKKDDPFVEGMDKIYKQLMTELENIGVKPIEALGKEFDPNFHNAVMEEESEEAESGTVLKELQKGYTYRDTVVRHSMVSVAS